jgi:hypothetical protein
MTNNPEVHERYIEYTLLYISFHCMTKRLLFEMFPVSFGVLFFHMHGQNNTDFRKRLWDENGNIYFYSLLRRSTFVKI